MSSAVRDRTVDVAIAGTLAVLPLLPTGPTYFGWRWPWALEVVFLFATALALLLIITTRIPRQGPRPLQQVASRGYLVWLIPMVGATVIGLLERNPPDLALLRIEAEGLVARLMSPMHQAADPLFPLRAGLTVLEGGLMFFLLSAVLKRTAAPSRRADAAIAGCLAGTTIVSGVALVQYVTRVNLHHYWVRQNPNLTRSHATLDDPNALASFLVLGIGLASGVAWASTSVRTRALALGGAALACAALVTTISRAGVAALPIAAVIVAAALSDRIIDGSRYFRALRRASRAALLVAAIAMVGWGISYAALPKHTITSTPDTPIQALLQTLDPRQPLSTLLKGRHLIWEAGVQFVGEYWIAGAGLGQFPRLIASYPGAGGAENAHNYFLQVFVEGGIAAFAGLLALLAAIAWAMTAAINGSDPAAARFGVGLSLGLVGFVLTWLTGHPLLTLSNQLWFAAVLAVGLAAAETRGDVRPETSVIVASVPGALASGTAVLLTVIITLGAMVPRAFEIARKSARRSHAVGVYGWEPAPPSEAWPDGTTFRWTRGRAAVREPVRGRILQVPIFLARPDIDRHAVTVDVTVGGVAVPSLRLTTNGWHVSSYDLPALLGTDRWQTQRAVTIEFVVRPTIVPAQLGGSGDTRELGIGLGRLQWAGDRRTSERMHIMSSPRCVCFHMTSLSISSLEYVPGWPTLRPTASSSG